MESARILVKYCLGRCVLVILYYIPHASHLYFILYIGTNLLHYYTFWKVWSSRLSISVCSIVLLFILKGTWNAFHPKYRHITITTSTPLAQNITIAFITDIHLGPILSNGYSHALIQRLKSKS